MGVGPLRVINEDRDKPAQGFGTHEHSDMKFISYVIEGALEHRDSMGTGSVIRPGDVQQMTAGTGVQHSEFNRSDWEEVHFLQLWEIPEKSGLEPSYEEKSFSDGDKRGRLRLVGSRDGRDGSITIHQDADLYAGILIMSEELSHVFSPGRIGWVQVVRGSFLVNGDELDSGDGVAIDAVNRIDLTGISECGSSAL